MVTPARSANWMLAVFWLVALSQQASAAVRICGEPVLVTQSGATEPEAKKKALDQWKAEAGKLGEGYTGWRIAADKVLTCKKSEDGSFACVARGSPCTIDQAPDKRELRSKRLDT